MFPFTKTVHVLALGLWFGTAVFFTFVVGLTLFDTFDKLAVKEGKDRPLWLPLPPEYDRPPPGPHFPEPLRKEQGSRVAGAAVGPMFPWYFGIQTFCGLLALAAALTWPIAAAGTAQRLRLAVLVLGVASVAAGWWLEGVVERLREQRSAATDKVLRSAEPASEDVQAAEAARAEFGLWHTYSLLVNFLTLALVTVAMALAAHLPNKGQGLVVTDH
jgi:hypothetical protein